MFYRGGKHVWSPRLGFNDVPGMKPVPTSIQSLCGLGFRPLHLRSDDSPGLLNEPIYDQCRKENSCCLITFDGFPLFVSLLSLANNNISFRLLKAVDKIVVSFMAISLKIVANARYVD